MNRCSRCGCFFVGNDTVCYNCVPYDNNDRAKLTDFCQGNEEVTYEKILYKNRRSLKAFLMFSCYFDKVSYFLRY